MSIDGPEGQPTAYNTMNDAWLGYVATLDGPGDEDLIIPSKLAFYMGAHSLLAIVAKYKGTVNSQEERKVLIQRLFNEINTFMLEVSGVLDEVTGAGPNDGR